MMRGVPVELPAAAREKLSAIEADRMMAEDSARGCQARINSLSDTGNRELLGRLTAERDRHAARHGALSQSLNRVRQWIAELRGVVLEPAPVIAAIKLKDGATVSGVIVTARDEIKSLQAQLQNVRRAPLPREDQRRLIA